MCTIKLASNMIRHFSGAYKLALQSTPEYAFPMKRGFVDVESEGFPSAPPLNRSPVTMDRGSKNDIDMWRFLFFTLHRMGCWDTHSDRIMWGWVAQGMLRGKA